MTVLASEPTPLPESGWGLRIGRGSHDRPALEVYTDDGLIDVAVAGGLDSALVRGAVRGVRGDHRWAVAWGNLPRGGDVLVEFRSGDEVRSATAVTVAGVFWVAEAPGGFRSVVVTTAVGRAEYRLRRFRRSRRAV